MACICPHPAITRSPIKIAPTSNKRKCLPCFDTRTYMTRMLEVAKMHAQPIFWLMRWYLDMYFFSLAEVLLEQNVDPGWVHHPLIPTLEQGGMQGGGWYHNSVKTTIFNNSVNSLSSFGTSLFCIFNIKGKSWLPPSLCTFPPCTVQPPSPKAASLSF
jgi:hypothetical protein